MTNKNALTTKNENEGKKTWLDLSAEQLKKLSAKSACMYGRKSKNVVSMF